ncbi:sulfurtransferase-like selenium metabolism protein YedF [Chitinilyticum aquatile]|uniref:sulfurtransferase-like selenium metabolism protein YedF n=1 Tax=Chitinilyticum aquatile TaxID=362520 RepID=UPI00041B2A55|nr:sulfurtransferase-like selenium metabolism protein YedF [Chitinilyticum aquatile]
MSNDFASTALVFNHDGLGHADEALRHKLASNYLRTLLELGQLPQAILFYAGGVKLVAHGSPCLAELTELAAAGVPVIACRTCLDFYGLMDQVAAGEIGNMLRIVEAQAQAAKVITL